MSGEQVRCEVRLDRGDEMGRTSRRLADAKDSLEIPQFGFRCRIADLYRRTALAASG